jgi:hypothetical protein
MNDDTHVFIVATAVTLAVWIGLIIFDWWHSRGGRN